MQFDKSDIDKIAWLARLSIAENDVAGYASELSTIFGLVEQMEAVDTDAIDPLAHPLELTARLREDKVTETDQREKFQSIAPAVKAGHYLVPRVIE